MYRLSGFLVSHDIVRSVLGIQRHRLFSLSVAQKQNCPDKRVDCISIAFYFLQLKNEEKTEFIHIKAIETCDRKMTKATGKKILKTQPNTVSLRTGMAHRQHKAQETLKCVQQLLYNVSKGKPSINNKFGVLWNSIFHFVFIKQFGERCNVLLVILVYLLSRWIRVLFQVYGPSDCK